MSPQKNKEIAVIAIMTTKMTIMELINGRKYDINGGCCFLFVFVCFVCLGFFICFFIYFCFCFVLLDFVCLFCLLVIFVSVFFCVLFFAVLITITVAHGDDIALMV